MSTEYGGFFRQAAAPAAPTTPTAWPPGQVMFACVVQLPSRAIASDGAAPITVAVSARLASGRVLPNTDFTVELGIVAAPVPVPVGTPVGFAAHNFAGATWDSCGNAILPVTGFTSVYGGTLPLPPGPYLLAIRFRNSGGAIMLSQGLGTVLIQ